MAVGEAVNGCSGYGTAADPYVPENFLGFRNAVGVAGAYVCMMNDIDVSKDAVYKTGITYAVTVNAAYIYGTAMTFSNTKTYNIGDVCTFNDGEHGLCTYTCLADGTVGVDVTDTTYWDRGGDPTKKLTGLMVTAAKFLDMSSSSATVYVENIFFESCVFDCTSLSTNSAGFIYHGANIVTFYDCKFSIFFNQHQSWSAYFISNGGQTTTSGFSRCSIYVRYTYTSFPSTNTESKFSSAYTTFTNCTTNIIGMSFVVYSPQTSSFGKHVRSSIVMSEIGVRRVNSSSVFPIPYATNCFISISFKSVNDSALKMTKTTLSGVNVFDKEAAQAIPGCTVTITSDGNLIQGTTAQCKDKDWLISKGFFTS